MISSGPSSGRASRTVSLLIPVRNEAAYINEELQAILAQDYPVHLIEVFVIDGDSDDATRELVESLRKTFAQRGFRGFEVISNPAKTAPAALNLGLLAAKGDIIMRVDGHSRIAPHHVRRCVELLEETGADNVGGTIDAQGTSATGRAIAVATTSPFGVGGSTFRLGSEAGWAQTVYPGAFPRSVFDKIGGFDEELIRNQDDEFNLRLLQSGGRVWFDPQIKTEHYARETLKAHFKQHFEFGLYKVRVMQKRGTVPAFRHLVPGAFVVSLGGSIGASLLARRPSWAAPIAIPYLTVASGAACVAGRKDPGLIPRIAVAFVLMHVGYGVGTIAGVFKWRRHFRRDARA